MARPTKLTPDVAAELCARLAQCGSLLRVCRAEDMPTDDRVRLWVAQDEDFAREYARAKAAGIDMLVEEALDIADDGSNDWQEREHGPSVNGEHVQRSKLRVEYRRWLAERMAPKKYGVRSEVDLKSSDGSMSPPVDEGTRAARAAQLLALAQRRREQQGADDFSDLA